MFARLHAARRARYSALLGVTALTLSAFAMQGGQAANAGEYNEYVDAPQGFANVPVDDDVIINYTAGKPVAARYKFSYICPTTPKNDLNPPYNVGNGIDQKKDFTEYQSQPCFFGIPQKNPAEAPMPIEEIGAAFPGVRELYGLAPWFEQVPTVGGQLKNLYGSNTPLSEIQTNCPRQGLPFTQVGDPHGSCLMHMNVLHFPADNGGGDLNYHVPGQVPLPAHSHILGDFVNPKATAKAPWGVSKLKDSPDRLGPTWWHPRSVLVLDKSIWPDSAGNCAAGRENCLTSMKALRKAQEKGQARPEGGSNILLYFSVQPISESGLNTLKQYSLNHEDGSVNLEGRALWEKALKANEKQLAQSKQVIGQVKQKFATAAEVKAEADRRNAPVKTKSDGKQPVVARDEKVLARERG
ncbi:MAG: hypothetical protein ACT4QG_08075 [Sporichthyaceae bacterium]